MMNNRIRTSFMRKKNEIAVLIVDFLIICSSYALLAEKHVSTDGYYHVVANDLWAPLAAGRVVWAAILQLLTTMGVNVFHEQSVCIIFFIAALTWCASRTLCNIRRKISLQEGVLYSIPILLGFINVCVQEWFIFAEVALFYAIGIVAAVESAIAVSKRKYVFGIFLLLIAVLCYQVMLSLFIVYALFFTYVREDTISVRNLIPSVAIGGVAGIASIAVQKIVKATTEVSVVREAEFSLESILQKVPNVAQKMWSTFLDVQGILPPVILPLLVIASLAVFVSFCKREKPTTWGTDVVFIGVAIVVCLGVIIVPVLLSSDAVWMPPRILVGVFALTSMLAMCAILRSTGIWRTVIAGLSIGVLVVNIFCLQAISVDVFKNNVLDQYLDHQAHAYIEQYEKESGNTVKSIAFYYDEANAWSYPEIERVWYDTNIRTILISGERLARINYHCAEYYVPAETSELIYEQYFSGKNWNTFMPDEQFVFDGDTLHWCIY